MATSALLLAACSRDPAPAAPDAAAVRAPIVTISADQAVSPVPPWQPPAIAVDAANERALRGRAEAALAQGRLYDDAESAIPLYYALSRYAPNEARYAAGFERALALLLVQGDEALAGIDDDPLQLREAHEAAAVARAVAPAHKKVVAFLARVDRADQAQEANRLGEEALNAGRIGEGGGQGALQRFGEALELRPGDVRASQGIAAAESALIRRAEIAADRDDYAGAERWLAAAAQVRPKLGTAADAQGRIAAQRAARVGSLRDQGLAALTKVGGIEQARALLANLLRIAPAGDPAASELRERIELATHYGLFRPGQAFTEVMSAGGRGPAMVVIPHGAFRMGAPAEEADSSDAERPLRNIRFPRGLAVSRTEITVGEFRRFMNATKHRARASRRGYSTAYDERSGNLVRRGKVDWQSDYTGRPATDDMPVVHVSAKDAMAYAAWLSKQTGHHYRLPSEAEFEYMLRAGSAATYPWGEGAPLMRVGNLTGALDVSPTGRRWNNAFQGYGDNAWGPSPVGRYRANAWGLHDVAGNVSEWVADCWHDSYRRAPRDGEAWVNPGCRTRVIRGGSWASSPAQTRSAWRQGSDADVTSARIGFRVVRDI
ncbi:formylglycine-generating enzyme family protein [Lysobacter silvisoli]|uniref:Formylglycine-generating enzyme family protein n=1 Tax=Lysobacter silvisoli TaxID=2293254 RepID=A0A371K2D1_9GAMM|nr:formylglycine-generating enzyme family protein [Lysobacter silvisoli]RDZ28007.1 formylglycine-generating enzyme family protein [Lysobacter silvisoli]